MAPAEQLANAGAAADSFTRNGDEYGTPGETFEILDPSFENGVPRRYRRGFWSRWLGMVVRTPRKQLLHPGEEEGDGLLHDRDGARAETSPAIAHRSYADWCIRGGNTTLSILLSLIVLNLLFGFATFLQLPGPPAPFSRWGKPGTTSEGLSWYPADFLRDVIPIPCHSHNDYWRQVPLFSALYNGCISVEADVWALDEELYVGHNTASLTVNRTFKSLYINPLVTILDRQNPNTSFYNASNHGVFDREPKQSLTLLVDVKTDGAETWPLVLQQLEPLRQRGWLSYMENKVVHRRQITVVGTGETPFNILNSNQTFRDAFFDAPLDQMWEGPRSNEGEPLQPGVDNMGNRAEGSRTNKLTSRAAIIQRNTLFSSHIDQRRGQGSSSTSPADSYTALNSYYASTSFNKVIGTIWWGKLSTEQVDLIRGQIRGAHHRGLKARYWDTPSWPTSLRNYIWDLLVQEGADVLNVDDLEAVRNGVW